MERFLSPYSFKFGKIISIRKKKRRRFGVLPIIEQRYARVDSEFLLAKPVRI